MEHVALSFEIHVPLAHHFSIVADVEANNVLAAKLALGPIPHRLRIEVASVLMAHGDVTLVAVRSFD